MVKHTLDLDATFAALADPTRRRIVERLARGELTAGEIAAGFAISQPAISKHLKVLENSGLLERAIDGRIHRCRLSPARLQNAADWIESQRRFWESSLDRLDTYLQSSAPKPKRKRK